jgi:hypothetical protein
VKTQKQIQLVPQWHQTDYTMRVGGRDTVMMDAAKKAAQGGRACLWAFCRKYSVRMNTARYLAGLQSKG